MHNLPRVLRACAACAAFGLLSNITAWAETARLALPPEPALAQRANGPEASVANGDLTAAPKTGRDRLNALTAGISGPGFHNFPSVQ